jgi:hypothetical protein
VNTHGCIFHPNTAASVLGQTNPGAFHLLLAGFSAKLQTQFVNLGQAGRTYRMTTGLQAAAGIHRQFPPQDGGAGLSKYAAFTYGAKPHGFSLVKLAVGCGVIMIRLFV